MDFLSTLIDCDAAVCAHPSLQVQGDTEKGGQSNSREEKARNAAAAHEMRRQAHSTREAEKREREKEAERGAEYETQESETWESNSEWVDETDDADRAMSKQQKRRAESPLDAERPSRPPKPTRQMERDSKTACADPAQAPGFMRVYKQKGRKRGSRNTASSKDSSTSRTGAHAAPAASQAAPTPHTSIPAAHPPTRNIQRLNAHALELSDIVVAACGIKDVLPQVCYPRF